MVSNKNSVLIEGTVKAFLEVDDNTTVLSVESVQYAYDDETVIDSNVVDVVIRGELSGLARRLRHDRDWCGVVGKLVFSTLPTAPSEAPRLFVYAEHFSWGPCWWYDEDGKEHIDGRDRWDKNKGDEK